MSNRVDKHFIGPTAIRKAFAHQVKERMKALNLTAAALSRRTRLSKDTIGSYIRMRCLPTPPTLVKLARALGCEPEELYVPVKNQDELDTVIEIHEAATPGHKMIVSRVSVSDEDAAKLFDTLMKYAKKYKATHA